MLIVLFRLLKIAKFEPQIARSPMVILDGNLPVSTIISALTIAHRHRVPGKCSGNLLFFLV